jgi:protein SCO1/2
MTASWLRILRLPLQHPLHLALAAVLAATALVNTRNAPRHTPRSTSRSTSREALPFYRTAVATPEWLDASAVQDPSLHRVAPFGLTDQNGRAVTERDVAGKVYVASFFFTTCRGLCPNLYTNLAAVLRAFPADSGIRVLSHTVTPEIDNVAALAQYAASHHIDDTRWRLLTGAPAEIRRLALGSYFVQLGDTTGNANGTMLHTETIVLVDSAGHIRGMYDGSLAFDTQRLIDDIHTLRGR